MGTHVYSASSKHSGAITDVCTFAYSDVQIYLSQYAVNSYVAYNSTDPIKLAGSATSGEFAYIDCLNLQIPLPTGSDSGVTGKDIDIEQVLLYFTIDENDANDEIYAFRSAPILSGYNDFYYGFFKVDDYAFDLKNANDDLVDYLLIVDAHGASYEAYMDITSYADDITANQKFYLWLYKQNVDERHIHKDSVYLKVTYDILPPDFISTFTVTNNNETNSVVVNWEGYDTSPESGHFDVSYFRIYYSTTPFDTKPGTYVDTTDGSNEVRERSITGLSDQTEYYIAIEPIVKKSNVSPPASFTTSNTTGLMTLKSITTDFAPILMHSMTSEIDTLRKSVILRFYQYDVPLDFKYFNVYRNNTPFDSISTYYNTKFRETAISIYREALKSQVFEDFYVDFKKKYYYCLESMDTLDYSKKNDLQIVSAIFSEVNTPSLNITQNGGKLSFSWNKGYGIEHLFFKYVLQRREIGTTLWYDYKTIGFLNDYLSSPDNWLNYGSNYNAVNDRFDFVDNAIISFNNEDIINEESKDYYLRFLYKYYNEADLNIYLRYDSTSGKYAKLKFHDISTYIVDNLSSLSFNGTWTAGLNIGSFSIVAGELVVVAAIPGTTYTFYKTYTQTYSNFRYIRVVATNTSASPNLITFYLKLTGSDGNIGYTDSYTFDISAVAQTITFKVPFYMQDTKISRIDFMCSAPSSASELHIDKMYFCNDLEEQQSLEVTFSSSEFSETYVKCIVSNLTTLFPSILVKIFGDTILIFSNNYNYSPKYHMTGFSDERISNLKGTFAIQCTDISVGPNRFTMDQFKIISPDIIETEMDYIQTDIDDVDPESDDITNYEFALQRFFSTNIDEYHYPNPNFTIYDNDISETKEMEIDDTKLPQPVTILSYTPYYNQTTGKYQIQLEWDWLEDSMDDADFEQWEIRMTEDSDNNPDLEDDIALSGTITMSASDMLVHGGSTKFTTELKVGNTIYPTGSTSLYEIASITSDTELVLTTNGEAATSVAGYKSTLYGVVTNVNQKSTTVPHTGYGSLIPASNYKIAVITVDKAGLKRYSGESE